MSVGGKISVGVRLALGVRLGSGNRVSFFLIEASGFGLGLGLGLDLGLGLGLGLAKVTVRPPHVDGAIGLALRVRRLGGAHL